MTWWRSRLSFPLILLFIDILQAGAGTIPPVTLITLVAQVTIFLRPAVPLLQWLEPDVTCNSLAETYYGKDWSRLVTSTIVHVNDWHLYYNMVSFLWKGRSLENRLGSWYFAYMLVVFAIVKSVLYLFMCMLAVDLMQDPSYMNYCSVGFSGVIFALKVVTTYMMPPGITWVLGCFPVYSRLSCWLELLLVQMLLPNASLIGHLAGIIVGILYVKGPLRYLMNIFMKPGYGSGSYHYPEASLYRPPTRRPYYEEYTGGLNEDQQFQQAMRQSQQEYYNQHRPRGSTTATAPNWNAPRARPAPRPQPATAPSENQLYPNLNQLDTEELRRRRLQRLDH